MLERPEFENTMVMLYVKVPDWPLGRPQKVPDLAHIQHIGSGRIIRGPVVTDAYSCA